jgi:bacterioferritin-associated ferredoxin
MRHRRSIDLMPREDAADYGSTLDQLAEWYVLVAKCGTCRHQAVLDRRRIAEACGHDAPLNAIARTLKCSRCGNRAGNDLLLGRLPRD